MPKKTDCSELPGSMKGNQHDGSGMATFKKCNSKSVVGSQKFMERLNH